MLQIQADIAGVDVISPQFNEVSNIYFKHFCIVSNAGIKVFPNLP